MIEVHDLSKRFAVGFALNGASFSVAAGEVCGLIGPNGAGKTTLLKILSTLLRPSTGTARVAGFDIRKRPEEVRKVIGYMPDVFGGHEELQADAYLKFFARVYRLPEPESWHRIADLLELVDLTHLRNRQISGLSLGARQRLGLARVLLHNPQVLLLDEPVSGLDPKARVEVRELLRELGRMGKTVLISSHVLSDLADLCQRLVIIEMGKVVFSGTLDELKLNVRPDRLLEIAVEGDLDRLCVHLRQAPWAREVKLLDQSSVEVTLDGEPASLSEISRSLFTAGFSITKFAVRELGLEDAFLRLSRKENP